MLNSAGGMRVFQLLGPVGAVFGDGHVDLGSLKQRIVLAVLLVEASRPVGAETLVDRVWDEAPAGDSRRMVSTYVSRLRRALGEAGEVPVELVRRPGGYELCVNPDLVDVHRFRRLVVAAEDPTRSDPERAKLLREALDLWRGTALSDLPGVWAERTRQAWHQQRLDATVTWAQLELRLGHAERVIGPLRDLVAEHPLAEPLAAVLMRALDVAGRTPEAMDCFATTRQRLVEDLGVEPGAGLRAEYETLLQTVESGAEQPRPVQLPVDLVDFVDRAAEISRLSSVLDPDAAGQRLVAISGPPGVGKTALAVRIGHALAPRFPDGQLYVALRGATEKPVDPADVLAQLLRDLGVDGSTLPAGVDARGALFRDRLAGRRILMILDDAGGHRQVEPLLPAGSAAVVVTSRSALTGLPGVTAIDLSPLPGPAAIELLRRVAGEDRVVAEPEAAADLVTTCGGLPLAVRIAAARLAARPHWTVSILAGRLSDERRRLDELRHGDLAVRPGLQVAYRGLTPAGAMAFALLGKLDVPSFPQWVVAVLLGVGPAAGTEVLEELLDARLVDELGPDVAGQPRYRFHELTRAYATEHQVRPADWAAALARAGAGWLALARRAQDGLQCERFHLDDRSGADPGIVQAAATDRPLAWFEAERDALVVLVPACAEAGLAGIARGLAGCCADFYELRGYYTDWRRTTEAALEACRKADDHAGVAAMLRGLGSCLVELDDLEAATQTLRSACALAEEAGDPTGAALAGMYIGFVLGLIGRLDEAEKELRASSDQLRRSGAAANESMALTSLGFVVRQRGDTAEAIGIIHSALAIARSCGDLFAQAYATRGLANALLDGGLVQEAEDAARQAAALFDRIGDPIGAAQCLRTIGEALARDPQRTAEAERALESASAIFSDRGHAWGFALVELSLGEIGVRQGAAEATGRLQRSLMYWTAENVPQLQARALVALGTAAGQAGDPAARDLLFQAYYLYRDLKAPQTAELAELLGIEL